MYSDFPKKPKQTNKTKQKQKRINKEGRKGSGKKEMKEIGFSKHLMPTFWRGKEEGRSLVGDVFPRGLRTIVFCDVCPNPDRTMLRFEQTKEQSPLLCYYEGSDRICKLFLSEEL